MPSIAFPLPYDIWYAATLFLEAGHDRVEVLRRVGLDEFEWKERCHYYHYLHFSGTGWVESVFEREGRADPEQDRALWELLKTGRATEPPVPEEPFGMRRALRAWRRIVEAEPRIGPFSDVDWIAVYICERRFPTRIYIHNGTRVHTWGKPLWTKDGTPIEGIDPASFRQLGQRWFRDAQRVYGQGETPTKVFWFVVKGADPESFTVLNERYAADKAAGYYITNRRLPTADPGSFQVIGYPYGRGQKPGFHVQESFYAKDSRKVYCTGAVIEGADPASFHPIGDEGAYFADARQIYWENKPIPSADRASFQCASEVGQYCAYDCRQPYWAGGPMSAADEFARWTKYFEAQPELADTWWHREKARRATPVGGDLVPLGGPYLSDGERVLVRMQHRPSDPPISLDHFDLASFRYIVDVFAVDRFGLRYIEPGYERYGRQAVAGADPETFAALGDGWYQDRNQIYFFDPHDSEKHLRIVQADRASFTLLGGAYARDAKGLIYHGIRKRDIADAAKVVGLGGPYARVGSGILYEGRQVSKLGALDVATACTVHGRVLMDARGHVLLDGRYRKPLPGIDGASFRFLNRMFAVDSNRVYALDDTNIRTCEIADRVTTEDDGGWWIRDRNGRIKLQNGRFERV